MDISECTDKQLIDGYLAGNQQMFEVLYERYRKPLYSYLNKMMPGQTTTADDIFQKTWIKAIDYLDRYEDRQTFFAWLVRIGRNNAIDHFRRNEKHQHNELDENRLSAGHEIPWRQIGVDELDQAIRKAVDDLPAEQLEVFNLRQNDLSFKEIAEIQQCSINTVLGRMHYAVNKLRKVLQEWKES